MKQYEIISGFAPTITHWKYLLTARSVKLTREVAADFREIIQRGAQPHREVPRPERAADSPNEQPRLDVVPLRITSIASFSLTCSIASAPHRALHLTS